MTAQVLQFRPLKVLHASGRNATISNVREIIRELPSDVESDTCSCPSCREPSNVIPQPKEEPFSA